MASSPNRGTPCMRIVLMGPPGAGKGTQATILAQNLGLTHVASGELFRHHQQKRTELGLKAKQYTEKGLLVPDEITITMVLERVFSPQGRGGVLLDGFPRNVAQAGALSRALEEQGQAIDRAVLIEVPEEELVRRLGGRISCTGCQATYNEETAPPEVAGKCDRCGGELYQRPDDTTETVQMRIRVYHEQTEPLVQYYKDGGKLVAVVGVGEVDEVGRLLLQALA